MSKIHLMMKVVRMEVFYILACNTEGKLIFARIKTHRDLQDLVTLFDKDMICSRCISGLRSDTRKALERYYNEKE